MSIKHRTGSNGVLAALKLTGVAAMALPFIMMMVLAGCPTEDDGGGGIPAELIGKWEGTTAGSGSTGTLGKYSGLI
jgi:hypothetical protein